MDFDLDLAKEQSQENPVFYLQYAHARIASLLKFAEHGVTTKVDLNLLASPEEAELIGCLSQFSEYLIHDVKVTRANTGRLFAEADILIEAFDKAGQKGMLINTWLSLYPEKPLIAASGLAGYGKNAGLRTRKMGNLYVCGDGQSQCPTGISPMAPRVAIVANMQANLAVELLVKMNKSRLKAED